MRSPFPGMDPYLESHWGNVHHSLIQYARPVLPVPLRRHEQPLGLDLQALVEKAYSAGRYDDIDYSKEPTPALASTEAAWVAEMLKAAGRR